MSAYINGMGAISAQSFLEKQSLPNSWKEYNSIRLACVEPDYSQLIDPKLLRRMSRILRMGMTSATMALKDADIEKPDAIITGTAYGCLEDTSTFLKKMIDNNEVALNPTPFIQSTHNTIGSQIALVLQCLGYNQTYSQRAFSFENALLDALMTAKEDEQILVGGIDEMTDLSFDILNCFNLYKRVPVHNLNLFASDTSGTISGEGAAYFVLSENSNKTSYAILKDVATFYKPDRKEILHEKVKEFLLQQSVNPSDIDLVIVGKNGDNNLDNHYDILTNELFTRSSVGVYKHLCGEYPTSTGFALWLSAMILKEKKIPSTILQGAHKNKEIKYILIYNQYLGDYHSLILLEAC